MNNDTVPLRDLVDLAVLGKEMRRAQRAYFEARRGSATSAQCQDLLRRAKWLEEKFDRACESAADRERRTLFDAEVS